MMALKSLDELTQMIASADATKTLFGNEQRGSSPTQHHPRSAPAFDTAGPGLGSRKAALNQIGRAERPHQRFVQSQACHRQRFFQSFFQTSCRAGANRIQPLHASTQLFQSFFGRALGPGAAQTPARWWWPPSTVD